MCAYVVGKRDMVLEVHQSVIREREEAHAKGILEGKESEKAKWVGDGHVAGKECKANQNECASIAVKTDLVLLLSPHSIPSSTTTTVQAEPAACLSWAEEVADIPIHSVSTNSTATPQQDLSVLKSESIKPFASLRRCAIISHSCSPHSKYPFSMLPSHNCSQAHTSPSCSKEKSSQPFKPSTHSHYDWSLSLLVLSDIARALGDMGWKPPDFFSHAF
jgi:hypothetical protein